MSGKQNISFFQKELHDLKYHMLSEDLLISCQHTSIYSKQLAQNLSNDRDKILLNDWF